MANYKDDVEYKALESKRTELVSEISNQESEVEQIQSELSAAEEAAKETIQADLEAAKKLLESAKTMLSDTETEMKQIETEYEQAASPSDMVEPIEEDNNAGDNLGAQQESVKKYIDIQLATLEAYKNFVQQEIGKATPVLGGDAPEVMQYTELLNKYKEGIIELGKQKEALAASDNPAAQKQQVKIVLNNCNVQESESIELIEVALAPINIDVDVEPADSTPEEPVPEEPTPEEPVAEEPTPADTTTELPELPLGEELSEADKAKAQEVIEETQAMIERAAALVASVPEKVAVEESDETIS